jgi:hypothetical protein
MAEIIAGFITIIIMVMKLYTNKKAQEKQVTPEQAEYDTQIKTLDTAIGNMDASLLNSITDGLRVPDEADGAASNNPGRQTDNNASRQQFPGAQGKDAGNGTL